MEQDKEPLLTRDEVAFAAQQRGYHVTAAQLCTAASRGAAKIPCVYRHDGRPTYRLSDVIEYARTRGRGRKAHQQHANVAA